MIKMAEYAKRRKALMEKIGANGIFILPAAKEIIRNGDGHYPFRQQSDFYYLTGFSEPEAVLVLMPNRKEGEYILFNRKRNREKEIWDGPRAGQEGACQDYLAEQAFPSDEFATMLPDLLLGREVLHYALGHCRIFDEMILRGLNEARGKIRSGLLFPVSINDLSATLHEMRLYKSAAEIACLQKAVDITGDAHVQAMQACQVGMFEYELEAEVQYQFNRQGARYPAYSPIVGAGANSCVLHYVANHQKIIDGDLVLIDAGAEYQNYAADITRTFPANGKFSAEQRAVYEVVLAAQKAAIDSIKPGSVWSAAQDIIVNILTQGLIDLGLLKGKLEDLISQQAYFPFYMHRSGHWLGLDVHDVGRYRVDGDWRKLAEGMVLTVEPGIYISADIPGVPERWHHIGVRIEDDVVVTATGCEVLSKKIPKEIAEIETLMAD